MKETLIRNAPLFSSLDPDEQVAIGKVMKELTMAKGETLFNQGQLNQRMFLIESGWIKQSTQLESGRNLVNNLGPGSLVGEMDVLLEEPAGSSATANSDLKAWFLSQADLNQVLDENPRIGLKLSAALGSRIKQVDRYLVYKRLRTIALFSDLGDEALNAIAEQLQPMEIRRGGLIFRAGAPGDAIFIIEDGEVSLTSAAEESGEPFRQLGTGEVMGEMAVLAAKPYDGLARAASEVVLWMLKREDFITVATRFPEVRVSMSGRLSQPLSSDDRAVASRQLTRMRLFADVPVTAVRAVSGVLVLRHYPAGEQLFKPGDPGDSMFIVDTGEIRLTGSEDEQSSLLPGSQYGENCLLTGKSRTETATAVVDSNLWILYRSDFDELLARFPVLGAALSKAVGGYLVSTNSLFLDNQLRHIPIFSELGAAELSAVAGALRPVQANRGEVVFAEGQRGDAIYFIESGEIQLGTRVGDSYQMTFERLIAGDFFGELALLADTPRTSTARAVVNDTQLWALDKTDFDRIAVEHPAVAVTLSRVLSERLARTSDASPGQRALPPQRPRAKQPPAGTSPSTSATPKTARPTVAAPKPVTPPTTGTVQRPPTSAPTRGSSSAANNAKPAAPKVVPGGNGSQPLNGSKPAPSRPAGESPAKGTDDLIASVPPTKDITPPGGGHIPPAAHGNGSAGAISGNGNGLNGNGSHAGGNGHLPGSNGKSITGNGQAPNGNGSRVADNGHITRANGSHPSGNGHGPNGIGGHPFGNGNGHGPSAGTGRLSDDSHLKIASMPTVDRPLPKTGTRPLAAKPSSVPVIKRPSATPPPPAAGTYASPLSVKPPVPARPQSRPVPKRPPAPLVQPKPRPTQRPASVSIAQAQAVPAKPRSAGMPQAHAVPSRPRRAPVPQSRTVAPRPVRQSQMPMIRTQQLDPATLAVVDSLKWVMARSVGFKFRMVALSMLFVWLCGITAPVAALSALAIQNNGGKVLLGGVAVNIGNDNGPRPQVAALAATFTATPPPTTVPTRVGTAQATPTKAPIVAVVIATNTPAPTARPRPTVSPTPAGPVVASVPVPQQPAVDFKIQSVRQLTPCENRGKHNLFVMVLDQQGNGIPNIEVQMDWPAGSTKGKTGGKNEYIASFGVTPKTTAGFMDFPINHGPARATVTSGTSEVTDWLHVDLPDQRCDQDDNPQANSTFHYSYLVVFQRTH